MKFLILLVATAAFAAGDELQVLRDGNDVFTAKMFAEVAKANPGKSVVLSAFSVLTPLAQLSLGAVGESHDELLRAIGVPNDNVTRVAFPLVDGKLRAVKGVDLRTASKIYIAKDYQLNENFATDTKSVFGSEVKNINFVESKASANEINAWVEDQTNHRIKDLVSADSLDALTRAVLVNAIYFKGSWKTKFNKEATTDRDFYVEKDKPVKVPTMYRKADFRYGESKELDAKLLEMPYEGDEASFLIVLPNAVDGLSALQEKLKDPAALKKAYDSMFSVEVEVYLPKFKIETTTNLKDILPKVGVEKIFDEANAGLERLIKTNEKLYISEAIQKAFIEVNEEGAEAAAANEFGIVGLSLVYSKRFKVDHPFVFYLKEKNTPLFEGSYVS